MNRYLQVLSFVAAALTFSAVAEQKSSLPSGFQGRFEFQATPDTVLHAELHLPNGAGPFPLVMVMHGGTGPGELEKSDVAQLLSIGYAAAVVDSFSGRGFKAGGGTGAGATIRPPVRVADAYSALNLLATHPQIDARRAVLFGRSHGGAAALAAATTWAKTTFSPNGASFKAFLALYPPCSTAYPELNALAGPMRLFLGEKDELTPAKACEVVAGRMREAAQDVSTRIYAGAHHAFDAPWPVSYFGQWLNYGDCAISLPSVSDSPSPEQVKLCVKRGTSMGGNPTAAAQFRRDFAEELDIVLRR